MSSPSVEGPSPQANKKKKIKIDNGSGPVGGRISANSGSLPAGSRKALNASPTTGSAAAASAAASAASQDTHPYARGSVIEVWHYTRRDDWWSEPDTSDEEQGEGGSHRTARLCDIIDRANVNNAWRYYVHYRDFNRRMDEWIGTERIVSPPSVGNAKARALKRKKHKASHGQAAVGSGGAAAAVASSASSIPSSAAAESDVVGPRSRRRTSLLQESASSVPEDAALEAAKAAASSAVGSAAGAAVGKTPVPAGGSEAAVSGSSVAGTGPKSGPGGPGGRRRRQSSRRKADDDATVVTSNAAADSDVQAGSSANLPGQSQLQQPQLKSNIKSQQIVLSEAMTTHTVGEHVVATVHAQELDEHEGLDEASLREHEEVTKVKNVNFLELGEFQMETWYV